MDHDREIRLTPAQTLHLQVMQAIAEEVSNTPYVLKGGAALIFTRKLDRYSTDLDFDSGLKLNLKGRIEQAVGEIEGIELKSLKLVKDTDTVQRYKLHYQQRAAGLHEDILLKIETSLRESPKPEAIEITSGIKTYRIDYQFTQKLLAAQERTRIGDLYDLAFLVNHYGSQLANEQIEAAYQFANDPDQLISRYSSNIRADDILATSEKIEDTVLSLHFGSERFLNERQQGLADISDANERDNQALYDQYSLEVTQPGLIGAGLIAQNALKASHSKAEVEFILLSHNPTLQGIMTEQGQDKAKKLRLLSSGAH
ncbi:MAG: nucleotidyl transferase AbiEii/AbiGii toxin family protein, partial [Acaryochloris sp. CRU_2_0]|nr:nucleotidyl transferase AbiEii/AbiGii toxin family protein [Acaryochloris sp. CRU_2_0]